MVYPADDSLTSVRLSGCVVPPTGLPRSSVGFVRLLQQGVKGPVPEVIAVRRAAQFIWEHEPGRAAGRLLRGELAAGIYQSTAER